MAALLVEGGGSPSSENDGDAGTAVQNSAAQRITSLTTRMDCCEAATARQITERYSKL